VNDLSFHGFRDPPIQTAYAYRAVLDAMARPGTVKTLEPRVTAPPPLLDSAAAICLMLCDYATPLWLAPRIGTHQVEDYLRFHAGAPIVEDIGAASFLLCEAGDAEMVLSLAGTGSDEYPDRSATLIAQVTGFAGELEVGLSGPGIAGGRRFAPEGMTREFWRAMQRNHALFPQGVDVLFAAPDYVAACPRSTRIDF